MSGDLKLLQDKINYHFKNPSLLERALTHRSLTNKSNHLQDYERLEFLGDRILGLVIAEMLLAEFKDEIVGAIAKRHSALVRGKTLVKIANELALWLYIKHDQSAQQVRDSILEDVCEALIAALYRDGGMDVARKFIVQFWTHHLHVSLTPPQDAKSQLQEWAQAKSLPLPVYTIENQTGPDHNPDFKVSVFLEGYQKVFGRAKSKKQAEKRAAEKLLKEVIDDK